MIEALGTNEIPRLRIGIGEPPQDEDMVDFVLGKFESAEEVVIQDAVDRAVEAIITVLTEDFEKAMNSFN